MRAGSGTRLGAGVHEAAQSRLAEAYGKLPLSFEANQGQFGPKVKFASRNRGYSLFLTPTEAVLSLRDDRADAEPTAAGQAAAAGKAVSQASGPASAFVRMKLAGSNADPRISGLEQQPGAVNYFVGNDPKKWRTKIPTYAKVRYENVYPGIDVVYYGNQGQLEYDFVVRPGADPKSIRFGLEGGGALKLDAQGDLVLGETGREIRFRKPSLYQEQGGKKTHVPGRYVLLGAREVGFQIAAYDPGQPLMIDPLLNYSTYFGGKAFDQVNAIAVDAAGNAYLAGVTAAATSFPTTGGSFETSFGCPSTEDPNNCEGGGASDAFVTKLNASGTFPIYSTYLGNAKMDMALALAIDGLGNAYVAGQTFSCLFPVTVNAFQTTMAGCSGGNNGNITASGDGFVAMLGPDGSTLLYSTFLGGSGLDEARGIALDASNRVYVAGMTFSTDFPTTQGAYQTTNHGGKDAFVAELNPTGNGPSDLVYSTYLGGSGFDQANGIGIDLLGNVYVTGSTDSTDFPVSNAFQSTCKYCDKNFTPDAFVTALNPGTGLVYSTFLGGELYDQGTAIAVDAATGDAYVTGFSFSNTTFPTTAGAFQTARPGKASAFVSKIAANGSLTYSTFVGSDNYTYGKAIAVLGGNAYVTGLTNADTFPLSSPIQSARAGYPDVFVTELNAAGNALYFSTYFGGDTHDEGLAIALDSLGNAYVSGVTNSSDLTTLNAFQSSYGLYCDGFIAKIQISPIYLAPALETFSAQNVGTTSAAQSVTLKNTGASALLISGITLTGSNSADFNQTSDCGSVSAGSTCTISITFQPTVTGPRTATLNVAADASGSPPQTVSLIGTAIAPAVTLSLPSVSFTGQQVNTTSAAQVVTLTNSGSGTLSSMSISITGADSNQFAKTTTCGASLNAGAGCTISLTFKPTSTGDKSAAVTIADNASDSPQSVSLTGRGLNNAVSLAPSPLSFGSQPLNTGATVAVTLTNAATSTDPVTVSGVTITGTNSGDFVPTNNCTAAVPVGQTCTISVTFTPTATGTRSATLSVTDNASGSPQTLGLTGVGGTGAMAFSPTSLSFASQVVGTNSAAKSITVTNTGTATLTFSAIAASGDFAQTNNCPLSPSTLAIGVTCTISVTFVPTATGPRSGVVAVADNAPGSPQTVPLSGTATAPAVSLSPSALTFAGQAVGTTSSQQTVKLSNTGNATLTINSIALTGANAGDFTKSTNCGGTLNAASNCSITVQFKPTAAGASNAALAITDNNGGVGQSVQTVSLTGAGTAPALTVSRASLLFGSQKVGTTGPYQTVTLTNGGTATLTLKSIALAGTNSKDFVLSNKCGNSLAVNSSCNIGVAFRPKAVGTRTAAVSITDNAPGSPQQISLSGNGM